MPALSLFFLLCRPVQADTPEEAHLITAQQLSEQADALRSAGDRANEQEKRREAAEAYLVFVSVFPDSEYVRMAMYNAAFHFEQIGDVAQANAIYARYANQYPEDARSWPMMFRLASNHADAMELEQAVFYFELLYHQGGPDYPDAGSALYNAAFLRGGVADFAGAARGFEEYARVWPDAPDAMVVMGSAGPMWERVGVTSALEFYRRFLMLSPDDLGARHRIAVLTGESGAGSQDIEQAWADLEARVTAAEDSSERARYGAMVGIRHLEAELAAFVEVRYPTDAGRLTELLGVEKMDALNAYLGHSRAIITAHPDPVGVTAALHLSGMGYLAFADMLLNAPLPAYGDPDEYRLTWEDMVEPIEARGREELIASLTAAETSGMWSVWVDRSVAVLAERYPDFAVTPPLGVVRSAAPGAALAAHHALALAHLEAGSLIQARFVCEKALASIFGADEDAGLLALRAQILLLQGERSGARQNLERAVKLDPGHPEALHRLAQMEMKVRRWSAAVAWLEAAAAADPESPGVQEDLRTALSHTGESETR